MALDYLVCAGIFLPMGKAVELLPSVDDASPDARKAPEETTSSSQHCAKETTTCRCHTPPGAATGTVMPLTSCSTDTGPSSPNALPPLQTRRPQEAPHAGQ